MPGVPPPGDKKKEQPTVNPFEEIDKLLGDLKMDKPDQEREGFFYSSAPDSASGKVYTSPTGKPTSTKTAPIVPRSSFF